MNISTVLIRDHRSAISAAWQAITSVFSGGLTVMFFAVTPSSSITSGQAAAARMRMVRLTACESAMTLSAAPSRVTVTSWCGLSALIAVTSSRALASETCRSYHPSATATSSMPFSFASAMRSLRYFRSAATAWSAVSATSFSGAGAGAESAMKTTSFPARIESAPVF